MSAHKEILKELSQKHHLPYSQVKEIIDSFYDGWKYYLMNPMESKGGILINGFVNTYIDPKKITNFIERRKMGMKKSRHSIPSDDFYNELLNYKKTYERQKSKRVHDEGSSIELSENREESIEHPKLESTE